MGSGSSSELKNKHDVSRVALLPRKARLKEGTDRNPKLRLPWPTEGDRTIPGGSGGRFVQNLRNGERLVLSIWGRRFGDNVQRFPSAGMIGGGRDKEIRLVCRIQGERRAENLSRG